MTHGKNAQKGKRARILASLGIALGLLTGCLIGPGGGNARLPEGAYFISGAFDRDYVYERYFVVLPERRWHWVEYGTNASKAQLCKVTLRTGRYTLGDSDLVLTQEAETPAVVKCGFSKQDFQALSPNPKKGGESPRFEVRNLKDNGFEVRNFFGDTTGWREYSGKKDPFGFY